MPLYILIFFAKTNIMMNFIRIDAGVVFLDDWNRILFFFLEDRIRIRIQNLNIEYPDPQPWLEDWVNTWDKRSVD